MLRLLGHTRREQHFGVHPSSSTSARLAKTNLAIKPWKFFPSVLRRFLRETRMDGCSDRAPRELFAARLSPAAHGGGLVREIFQTEAGIRVGLDLPEAPFDQLANWCGRWLSCICVRWRIS